MVNLLNSKMVIICLVELVSPNIERKHLKTNKYFKNRQAGNSKIGIMNTNSWGLRQKWSATAASGTRVVYSVPEKGVSGTEYPFRTGKACFLHRMPQKMRRVPQEAVLRTARIFRTVGGRFRYRVLSDHTASPLQAAHVEARFWYRVLTKRQTAAAAKPRTSQKSPLLAALLRIYGYRSGAWRTKKEVTSIGDLSGDACRIQTYDLLIRSQMLYSAELRRQSHTGEPVLYYYSTSFIRPRLASLMRAFLPARARM